MQLTTRLIWSASTGNISQLSYKTSPNEKVWQKAVA